MRNFGSKTIDQRVYVHIDFRSIDTSKPTIEINFLSFHICVQQPYNQSKMFFYTKCGRHGLVNIVILTFDCRKQDS